MIKKRPKNSYSVLVGNIGTVYSGHNKREANRVFGIYIVQSKSGRGRAGNEGVVILAEQNGNEDIIREYSPAETDEASGTQALARRRV